jgi:hypothetical protein
VSRGLGKTQRHVLDCLAARSGERSDYRWVSVFEIAHHARCEGELEQNGECWEWYWKCAKCNAARPTPAEAESIRRALRALGVAGLVEAKHIMEATGRHMEWVERWTYGGGMGAIRRQLFARLPLSVEEAEEERVRQRLLREQLAKKYRAQTEAAA